ncbi:MAG: hypothetical protein GW859_00320 [Sphingomonadales bacterium]|nr:hypothetical protein [Sphingomonadales bacterium]
MTRLQRWLIAIGIILTVPACATTRTIPGPPTEVLIPVPVPCEPVQAPAPVRPKVQPGAGLFDLAKTALADRRVLEGHVERLEAANKNPCPEAKQ